MFLCCAALWPEQYFSVDSKRISQCARISFFLRQTEYAGAYNDLWYVLKCAPMNLSNDFLMQIRVSLKFERQRSNLHIKMVDVYSGRFPAR